MGGPPATAVVLYDGVCGLCNRLVHFLLVRDRPGHLRFAALQSDVARELLTRHGRDASDLDTVYVIADWNSPAERVLARSRAVLYTLGLLGGIWPALGRLATLVPDGIADLAYNGMSRVRYRIFGRYDACPLPPPRWRSRFLNERGTPEAGRAHHQP